MWKTITISLFTTLMCFWCAEAGASIVYSFKALSNPYSVTGSFSITVPSFISSNTVFTPEQFESSSIAGPFPNLALGDMGFNFNFFEGYDMISFKIMFTPDTYTNRYYYFKPGTFGKFGSFDSELHSDVIPQDAHLDIYEELPSVRIGGSEPVYLVPPTLQNYYNNAFSGAVIEMKHGSLDTIDTLTADDVSGKVVTLKGGFDADYVSNNGSTNIHGPIIIRNGTVRTERVNVR
jgi:hypothetical protein